MSPTPLSAFVDRLRIASILGASFVACLCTPADAKSNIVFRRVKFAPEVFALVTTLTRTVDAQGLSALADIKADLDVELQRDIPAAYQVTIRSLQKLSAASARELQAKKDRFSLLSSLLLLSGSGINVTSFCSPSSGATPAPQGSSQAEICATAQGLAAPDLLTALFREGRSIVELTGNSDYLVASFQHSLRRSQFLNIKNVIRRNYDASMTDLAPILPSVITRVRSGFGPVRPGL